LRETVFTQSNEPRNFRTAVLERIAKPDPLAPVDVTEWLVDPSPLREPRRSQEPRPSISPAREADVERVVSDVDKSS
jgi:hypothetical protein